MTELPLTRDPAACPKVVVTGDFFARFSPFFMDGVRDLYAARGIILKPVDLTELFLYVTYDGMREMANQLGTEAGRFRPRQSLHKDAGTRWTTVSAAMVGISVRKKSRAALPRDILCYGPSHFQANDVVAVIEKSSKHISPRIFGEVTPTVGRGLNAEYEGYDGIILIGPFNCLPFRISESILKPVSIQHSMPLLSYETDGCAVSPAVLRQVDVHIQQVLDHSARIHSMQPDS